MPVYDIDHNVALTFPVGLMCADCPAFNIVNMGVTCIL